MNSKDRYLGLDANKWAWAGLLLIVLLTVFMRSRLLDVPLERDEGEYACAGRCILEGIPPYATVYNMKLPGIYAAYALVMAIFGQTHTGIHLGLLVLNCVSLLLVFLLAKRLMGPWIGTAAAAAFAALSISRSVQGLFANSEHFLIVPALGGALLLFRGSVSRKPLTIFFSGVLLGLAFVIKQHGAAFAAFGVLYLFLNSARHKPVNWKRLVIQELCLVSGAVLPFCLTCVILLLSGVFGKFWFWTFQYASRYVSSIPLEIGVLKFQQAFSIIASSSLLIWILAGAGVLCLKWTRKANENALFIGSFAVFSFLAVCPGFYFRPHYFVLLLPAAALLAGAGSGFLGQRLPSASFPWLRPLASVLLIVLPAAHSLFQEREYLFEMSPAEVARSTFEQNPFQESLKIAEYIRERTSEEDSIAVVGSEPQIYFYSGRSPATAHIYTYALMEYHEYALNMQKEMIEQIESASPAFIVYVNVESSWIVRSRSHMLIFEWFMEFTEKNYKPAGVVIIPLSGPARYTWDESGEGVELPSPMLCWVCVFKKK